MDDIKEVYDFLKEFKDQGHRLISIIQSTLSGLNKEVEAMERQRAGDVARLGTITARIRFRSSNRDGQTDTLPEMRGREKK